MASLVDESTAVNGSEAVKWDVIRDALTGRPRSAMECRLQHLAPSSKEEWREEEDKRVVAAQERLGNDFRQIAVYIKGRSNLSVEVRYL